MFTGIVEEIGRVTSARSGKLIIAATETLQGVKVGDSIAVNGVCLTVTKFGSDYVAFDIMLETVKRSNLGLLKAGDKVNLERAMVLGERLGGHLVQGHIDGTGKVASITREGEEMLIRFEAPSEVTRYIVEKGFVAVDGVSLTVVNKDSSSFQVSIVGHTREHTVLGERRVGDLVNLEVDIIAKYIEQLNQPRSSRITTGFLQEHGF